MRWIFRDRCGVCQCRLPQDPRMNNDLLWILLRYSNSRGRSLCRKIHGGTIAQIQAFSQRMPRRDPQKGAPIRSLSRRQHQHIEDWELLSELVPGCHKPAVWRTKGNYDYTALQVFGEQASNVAPLLNNIGGTCRVLSIRRSEFPSAKVSPTPMTSFQRVA